MNFDGIEERVWVYLPEFKEAGVRYGLDWRLPASVCDRETDCGTSDLLDVPGPAGRGDGGHGHGLMQIDDRTWGEWLKKYNWKDPKENIAKGTEILRDLLSTFTGNVEAAIAAYNAGAGNVRKALGRATPKTQRQVLDEITTKRAGEGGYVSGVLGRFERLKNFHPAVA